MAHPSPTNPQTFGTLDQKTKLKIALEEWVTSEFEVIRNQHEVADVLKTRFVLLDSIFLRPNQTVAAFSYEHDPRTDTFWIFLCLPIIQRLDQSTFQLLSKIILLTLTQYLASDHQNLLQAEVEAFNKFVEDQKGVNATKTLQHLERLNQILYLLTTQFFRQGLPVVDTKSRVPPSDEHLQKKLSSAFSRIRSKVYDYSQKSLVGPVRFRIIPYLFQEIWSEGVPKGEHPVRVRPLHSFVVQDREQRPLFTTILLTTQFLELLDDKTSEVLDHLLVYEFLSVMNALKYNRGTMEKEIYSFLSQHRDATEEKLYGHYSREAVVTTRKFFDTFMNQLMHEKSCPIVKVFA